MTDKGKKMPVDPNYITVIPDGMGDMVVITTDGRIIRGKLTMQGTKGAVQARISHFATCPAAEEYRKKKQALKKNSG
jgi:hypothetical protein